MTADGKDAQGLAQHAREFPHFLAPFAKPAHDGTSSNISGERRRISAPTTSKDEAGEAFITLYSLLFLPTHPSPSFICG
jgi:hypothetical protein